MSEKATNPKDAIASNKLPTHLVPYTVIVNATLAYAEGAFKYGAYNWRVAGVRASVYRSAMERHLQKWWNGEWADPVTGVPHLANVIACAGIILDAKEVGKLTDDRPPAAPASRIIDEQEKIIAGLRALFADKNPWQFTIADTADDMKECIR